MPPAVIAMTVLLLPSLVCEGVAAGDPKPRAGSVEPTGTADRFGAVEASGLRWLHLSSRHGDLPVPTTSRQQTAVVVVADLDTRSRSSSSILGRPAVLPRPR
jgi:hypothetical protein